MNSLKRTLPFLITSALLTACGSSSDSSSGSGYVQMYNASYNSPIIYLDIDDVVRTGAEFGEVSTRHSYNTDTYDLEYVYLNDNDDYISLLEDVVELKISKDIKLLNVVSGDFNEPRIDTFELKEFDEEDKFQISAINTFNTNKEYDVYLAKDDYAFIDAELLTTTSFLTMPELVEKEEDNYTLYVNESGSQEVIFESKMVDFDDETNYIIMLRSSYSTQAGGLVLDIVSDSSSVTSLTHVDAQSQIRFYNSIDDYQNVHFKAQSASQTITTDLTPYDTTSAYHAADAGTFNLSMLDSSNNPIISNYIEAVSKDTSLLNIFYKHKDDYPAMISVTEDLAPNDVSHRVQIVNLIDTSPFGNEIDEIDVYFTEGNETIEDTTSYVKDLDSYETKSLYLDSQSYDLTITYTANDQTISIMQKADVDFSANGNYVIVLEEDESQASGYKMTLLNTIAQ